MAGGEPARARAGHRRLARHRPGASPAPSPSRATGSRSHCGRSRDLAERGARPTCPATVTCSCRRDMADADAVGAWSTGPPRSWAGSTCWSTTPACSRPTRRWTTSYDAWRAAWSQTLAVNLVGAANATLPARVPHLIAAGGGRGRQRHPAGAPFRGEPNNPAYGASEGRAQRVRPVDGAAPWRRTGISVTCVAPGFVQTEMAREVLDGPRRGRRPGAVALRPDRPARGGRGGGAVAGLAGGAVLQRHHRATSTAPPYLRSSPGAWSR